MQSGMVPHRQAAAEQHRQFFGIVHLLELGAAVRHSTPVPRLRGTKSQGAARCPRKGCLCSQFRIALVVEDCDWRLFSSELDTIGGVCDLNALQDPEAEWLRAEPSADPNDDSSRPSRHGYTRWISGCSTFVPIVQATYLRQGDDFCQRQEEISVGSLGNPCRVRCEFGNYDNTESRKIRRDADAPH
jgi:hypothetical protein